MSKKNQTVVQNDVSTGVEGAAAPATETPKRGRPAGVKMTPEQKALSHEKRINKQVNKVLNSEEVKEAKYWKNVSEAQIRAIVEVASKATETNKAERLAALQAEMEALKANS